MKKNTKRRNHMKKEGSLRAARQGSFRVKRGDLNIMINVVKLEAEKPAWTQPALRKTAKGAKLRKQGSIRKGNGKGIPFALVAEQKMFGDLQNSMEQLGASIAGMGLVLERGDDEEQ
jgi:hypothetical protein